MKKSYITPTVVTVMIETTEIMAFSDTKIWSMTPQDIEEGNGEVADAATYRSTLWD